MRQRLASTLLAMAIAPPLGAQTEAIDAAVLPPASKRLEAGAEECSVWQREASFARSM